MAIVASLLFLWCVTQSALDALWSQMAVLLKGKGLSASLVSNDTMLSIGTIGCFGYPTKPSTRFVQTFSVIRDEYLHKTESTTEKEQKKK